MARNKLPERFLTAELDCPCKKCAKVRKTCRFCSSCYDCCDCLICPHCQGAKDGADWFIKEVGHKCHCWSCEGKGCWTMISDELGEVEEILEDNRVICKKCSKKKEQGFLV